MNDAPFFSVVLPTYGRGRHIRPSIESVLGQSFGDFELIVVGDGCADETASVVRSFAAERIKWRNLPHNSGSQSAPNNEGVRESRGQWIAYIGHDDIWSPGHLKRIFQTIAQQKLADFVVSGCVFHGPKGSEDYYVTGLFESSDAPFRHFCPPTSISHRHDVIERMGGWRDPLREKSPADNEFLLRAAHSRMRFVSTGEITVHKFAAGHRYLSYLRPNSDEQRELLNALMRPSGIDIDAIVRKSKANDQFMVYEYGDYSGYPEGHLFQQNLRRKGISRPALQPLREPVLIEQTDEPRGMDWHPVEGIGKRYRWSGPNPRPKILIPFTGDLARISIEVVHRNLALHPADIMLSVEERPVPHKIQTSHEGTFYLIADIALQQPDHTVLTLNAPTFRRKKDGRGEDQGKVGLAVGQISLTPIEPRFRLLHRWQSRVIAFLRGQKIKRERSL